MCNLNHSDIHVHVASNSYFGSPWGNCDLRMTSEDLLLPSNLIIRPWRPSRWHISQNFPESYTPIRLLHPSDFAGMSHWLARRQALARKNTVRNNREIPSGHFQIWEFVMQLMRRYFIQPSWKIHFVFWKYQWLLSWKCIFFSSYFPGGSRLETQINPYFLHRLFNFHQIFGIWS